MNPTHFTNISAVGESPAEIISRLMSALHGIAAKHKLKYAVAFPDIETGRNARAGNIVQVFSDQKTLNTITTEVEKNKNLKVNLHIRSAEEVPDQVDSWTQYRLFRIPNRNTRTQTTRENRIKKGQGLPYIQLASRTNGHSFSMRIQPVKTDTASDNCEPNSYGLAVTSRLFSLPNVGFATKQVA